MFISSPPPPKKNFRFPFHPLLLSISENNSSFQAWQKMISYSTCMESYDYSKKKLGSVKKL